MVIRCFGKARESLTFSSESYKELVRKYLETMGYALTTDSYVEGQLNDMTMINPNVSLEREFWVEF